MEALQKASKVAIAIILAGFVFVAAMAIPNLTSQDKTQYREAVIETAAPKPEPSLAMFVPDLNDEELAPWAPVLPPKPVTVPGEPSSIPAPEESSPSPAPTPTAPAPTPTITVTVEPPKPAPPTCRWNEYLSEDETVCYMKTVEPCPDGGQHNNEGICETWEVRRERQLREAKANCEAVGRAWGPPPLGCYDPANPTHLPEHRRP